MKELRKKDLLISFMKVTMEIKMFQSQKTKNSSDDKSDREVETSDREVKNYESECLIPKQPTRGVLQN